MPWKVTGWHLLFSVAGRGEKIGSQAARTGWQDGRGDGRGPLSPDIFPGSYHACVRVQVCVCVYSTSLQLRRRLHLCALMWVCFSEPCACTLLCVCLPVSLHKRRLSWQLVALLNRCFAKFRLLLSNIQTPPNHQPAQRPGLCLMPATLSSSSQVPVLCQDCHIERGLPTACCAKKELSAVVS